MYADNTLRHVPQLCAANWCHLAADRVVVVLLLQWHIITITLKVNLHVDCKEPRGSELSNICSTAM